jgi:lipoprotein-releasing system permease protein
LASDKITTFRETVVSHVERPRGMFIFAPLSSRFLNTELFIARRIVSRNKANFSRPIVLIAIVSIALGLAVMFMSVAILTGFQQAIREKVIGFGGHIQVTHFSQTQSLDPLPVSRNQDFLPALRRMPEIRHIQVFGTKAGIIKTEEQIQGMVLKGVGTDYDWSFFRDKMIAGRIPMLSDTGRSDEVIISGTIAGMLNLKLNDDLRMYFVSGDVVLGRKFKICGIYQSGMEEFDKMYVIGDIRHIQKLNHWAPDQVGGFEITLKDFNDLDRVGGDVYRTIGFSLDAKTIRQLYPQIFDWLNLQDINVIIILVLMVLVAAITMISTLLILILEKTRMIGTLKALGMRNTGIRRIFLYNSVYIIGLGVLTGNLIGFAIALLQLRFGFLKLPEESYYVSVVPVHLGALNIILLNLGTVLVCYLMLIIPSMVITKVSPVKAIRFK